MPNTRPLPETTSLLIERRWMLFVDGENFAKRGYEVLAGAGLELTKDDPWHRDVYLWLPNTSARYPVVCPPRLNFSRDSSPPPKNAPAATRSYYYSSTTSDEPGWTKTRLAMRDDGFEPKLFKREHGKSKAVDLALATDVLTLASEDHYDVAVIFSGDGDYVPVVEAVKRLGRHVVVGFFGEPGHGLNDELRIAADAFVDVGPALVRTWKQYRAFVTRDAAASSNGGEPSG